MLSQEDFVHPVDAAALRKLEKIPGFPALVKKVMELGLEQYNYGVYTASYIKLSDKQLPNIHNKLVNLSVKFGIRTPDLFLEMNPTPNAYTTGDTRTTIIVTSGLIEGFTDEEINAVLAHECGHIICHHVLYNLLVQYLINGALQTGWISNLATLPLQIALLYWSRMSELSCDRVAAIATSPETALSMLARLAGGPYSITKDINFEAWAEQANEYDLFANDGFANKTMQTWATMFKGHPFTAVRVRELLKWCASKEYWDAKNKLEDISLLNTNKSSTNIGNYCPNCKKTISGDWDFCIFCGHNLKNNH